MKEELIVSRIENELNQAMRYFQNTHGTMFSKNGAPDFVTLDKNGRFVGIEAKAPNKSPYINQWRRCIEILLSGGRYIVAQDDFTLENMDDCVIKDALIGCEIGYSEFIAADELKIRGTTEIKLMTNERG